MKWDHTGSPTDLEAAAADARNALAALLPMDARVVGVECDEVAE